MLKEMLQTVPLYERKNEIFIEIFNAETKQFETLLTDIDDIKKQMIVDTATWGLAIYEKELKLSVSPNMSLEERRTRIKTKWQSGGKVGRVLLENVASAIFKTAVKVSFDGKIGFNFKSKSSDGTARSYSFFDSAIDEIKPAHLGMKINVLHQYDNNIYYGGIVSTRNKIEIAPATFEMPNLQHSQYHAGFISTRSITTIQEVS